MSTQPNPPRNELEQKPRRREERIIQIPIGVNEWVALQVPTVMKEAEWNQMIAVLEAMKPGLVDPNEPPIGDVIGLAAMYGNKQDSDSRP